MEAKPKIWAVGGGKGGVGKSVLSTLLAFWLARKGKQTVLVDTDLGGANLHTLMGIKTPSRTINDFVTKKYATLEEICLPTEWENLRLISGISEVLSLANLQFAQKVKIIQFLYKLDCEYVVLDLGAGTHFNVLDFFLVADKQIVVLTPQPISIQNAYAFVRNSVYRSLSRLASQKPTLAALVKSAMDPKNELRVRTIKELLQIIEDAGAEEDVTAFRHELAKIKPLLLTNMVMEPREKNAGRIIQVVSEKYLMINPKVLGGVSYDRTINNMVNNMVPFATLDQSSEAFASVYQIASSLM